MAWPLTPLRTYIANSLPAIAAADLNSIQSAINWLFGGVKTVASVEADGTGGAPSTASAGNVVAAGSVVTAFGDVSSGRDVLATRKVSASGAISSATPGVGQSVSPGAIYKDTAPIAWGWIQNNGAITVVRSANVSSVTHNAAGAVSVVLASPPANAIAISLTLIQAAGASNGTEIWIDSGNVSNAGFKVITKASNVGTDVDFMFTVFGG